jgi:hypothetical protein
MYRQLFLSVPLERWLRLLSIRTFFSRTSAKFVDSVIKVVYGGHHGDGSVVDPSLDSHGLAVVWILNCRCL